MPNTPVHDTAWHSRGTQAVAHTTALLIFFPPTRALADLGSLCHVFLSSDGQPVRVILAGVLDPAPLFLLAVRQELDGQFRKPRGEVDLGFRGHNWPKMRSGPLCLSLRGMTYYDEEGSFLFCCCARSSSSFSGLSVRIASALLFRR